MSGKILDGIVVLDLTRFLSGPQCTLLLAGLGAEVIKIDDPATGDPTVGAPPFVGLHGISFSRQSDADYGIAYLKRARGKRSAALDLKHPAGHALFLDLVKKADVLVENFRVGVTQRLGIDYDALQKLNERLVYCSLTGYGSSGPDCQLKAYDLMVQAATGFMSITGAPGSGPLKAGSPLSDTIAGSVAALGVVSALFQRERTGNGQFVDVSMADCLLSMIFDEPLDCYAQLNLEPQQGNRIMRFSPFNTYRTSDGWIAIGAATNAEWMALLDVMDRADLKTHSDWSRVGWRIENNPSVDALIGDWVQQFTTEALLQKLVPKDVPCSPVRSVSDVLRWPQVQARGALVNLQCPDGHTTSVVGPGFPLKFSKADTRYDLPAPIPGEHTAEILGRFLGIEANQFEKLRAARVV